MSRIFGAAIGALAISFGQSRAAVTISSQPTQNVACANGICAPTASSAVLNVTDLENLLASGNVVVTTVGSGGVQANDIDIDAAFGWSSANTLSLDAFQTIAVNSAISITGLSALSITTNDGGTGGEFSIGRKANITFQNLSSGLSINQVAFTLVDSISQLANAIASNPSGDYAFAVSYDAGQDGTYTGCPIDTIFSGVLDGLENDISNLSIRNKTSEVSVALFFGSTGAIQHLGLLNVDIEGSKKGGDTLGTFAGDASTLFQVFAKGKVTAHGKTGWAGGLAGAIAEDVEASYADVYIDASDASHEVAGGLAAAESGGAHISQSISDGAVITGKSGRVGGLVGENIGWIDESFATGNVSTGDSGVVSGLVGLNLDSTIENSYANGAASGGSKAAIGGLIGEEQNGRGADETVEFSYATGAVGGGLSSAIGGFVGVSGQESRYDSDYWDTTTSGTTQARGKGRIRNIKGLTTEQLQSGLPTGFAPSVWGEKASINNGMPFLLNNPPPK